MKLFLRLVVILALACPSLALAQGGVVQSQPVVTGHPARWLTNGVIADGGSPTQGLLTGVGVTNPGLGVCQNSGPITTNFAEICLGFGSDGIPTITLGGPAAPAQLNLNIGGTNFVVPGTGSCVGCGTMAGQNSNAVNISGGVLNNVTIGSPTVTGTLTQGGATNSNSIQTVDPLVPSGDYTIFGTARVLAATANVNNAIVGVGDNLLGGSVFLTAVTGYARLGVAAVGSQAFGGFFAAEAHTTGGPIGEEINCKNYYGAPSTMLPPNQGFGSNQTNCIGLQIVSYGNYNDSIAMQIIAGANDAETANIQWEYGLYFWPKATTTYDLYIAADPATVESGKTNIVVQNNGGVGMQLQGLGASCPLCAMEVVYDGNTNTGSWRRNGYIFSSLINQMGASGLVATGSAQSDALPLTHAYNEVDTVASGTGVGLLVNTNASLGSPEQVIWNRGANTLKVYPPGSATIDGGTVNVAVTIAAGSKGRFVCNAIGACFSS